MPRFFHVSSSRNHQSIVTHGLDWLRMNDAPGIAGSSRPEQQGVFLCVDEFEVDWFVDMNNTGGAVDVWAVDGIHHDDLIESPEGHAYVGRRIPPERLTLIRADVAPGAS